MTTVINELKSLLSELDREIRNPPASITPFKTRLANSKRPAFQEWERELSMKRSILLGIIHTEKLRKEAYDVYIQSDE